MLHIAGGLRNAGHLSSVSNGRNHHRLALSISDAAKTDSLALSYWQRGRALGKGYCL